MILQRIQLKIRKLISKMSKPVIQLGFYGLLLAVTAVAISTTLYHYPLFPLQTDSLEWSNTWLLTTVVDFYGACLCLCGVILCTEQSWSAGVGWCVGCCLLGSPVCCIWVLWKVWQGKTLQLQPSSRGENMDPLM